MQFRVTAKLLTVMNEIKGKFLVVLREWCKGGDEEQDLVMANVNKTWVPNYRSTVGNELGLLRWKKNDITRHGHKYCSIQQKFPFVFFPSHSCVLRGETQVPSVLLIFLGVIVPAFFFSLAEFYTIHRIKKRTFRMKKKQKKTKKNKANTYKSRAILTELLSMT